VLGVKAAIPLVVTVLTPALLVVLGQSLMKRATVILRSVRGTPPLQLALVTHLANLRLDR